MKNYLIVLFACIAFPLWAAETRISSPDGTLVLSIDVSQSISVKAMAGNTTIFEIRNIDMLTDKGHFPATKRVKKVKKNSVNRVVQPVIKEKKASIPERYNEAVIEFGDKTKIQFRLYNEGFAYRFLTDAAGDMKVLSDNADFIFPDSARLTFQKDDNLNSAFENPYVTEQIGDMTTGEMGNLPALVSVAGHFVLCMEAGTKDYPVMWLKKADTGLSPHYWGYPLEYNSRGSQYDRRHVVKSADYIAQTTASRSFPWKVFGVADKETKLLANQLVYLLGEECKIADPSWIKPGWVTFDWWSRRGIYGVDFVAGINTETAKYMIDFAHEFGIRYFLFDLGWTRGEDLSQVVAGLDIPEVVRYAQTKGVDVMLWVIYDHFAGQMEKALKTFAQWGIKGVKIDFMNRSDQEMVDFYWKAAERCAEYKMVIDFHGAYRPDGLRRAYPNVLTREALIEFEFSGGGHDDNPDHHCTLPFIRNVAGPMDYIPGTMNNATKGDFRINGNKPMGQGTRAHSLAMAVITESPMQMLSDAQPLYYQNRECTEFLLKIPVEWDDIVPLDGAVGDYVALARKNGNDWYVAAITDWTPRKLNLTLDFLSPDKTYQIELIRDGINANTTAVDYAKEVKTGVKKGDEVNINMASGGGWIAKIQVVQ
ncbi:glycoside hydrolase family 97 protein [Candidatus Symbiothrix dinenymphae]|uniref:glycoside hydrolase family 97 protein n=1 Tax=Candidatus Symbiothrix dinenymphae TaxID=467085 RepID=UPI0006C59E2B|nr:glycoside hydrolase family 97 protein [Candidatus Symbiothrix dinenymphae]GAP72936.1 alpha-glucosidase [Candidatus Symbiothrix dinenymphae]